MQLAPRFTANWDWALIPGPADQARPMSSLDVREMVNLPAESLAQSLLAFPGTCLIHPAEPSWWEWHARWEAGDDFLELDFSLFDDLGDIWGGSHIAADCPSATLLSLLHHLNQQHAGIWLHDPNCGMHAYQHLAGGE